jgi:hypothetical protein
MAMSYLWLLMKEPVLLWMMNDDVFAKGDSPAPERPKCDSSFVRSPQGGRKWRDYRAPVSTVISSQ